MAIAFAKLVPKKEEGLSESIFFSWVTRMGKLRTKNNKC
jgi:hypothetical protein